MPYQIDGLAPLASAIAVLTAILWGALWLLRRARPQGAIWSGGDCRIVRSLALGPRERLLVVRVGGKELVVGVGSGAVSFLCELEEPLTAIPPANAGFGEAVRKAMERWRGG